MGNDGTIFSFSEKEKTSEIKKCPKPRASFLRMQAPLAIGTLVRRADKTCKMHACMYNIVLKKWSSRAFVDAI